MFVIYLHESSLLHKDVSPPVTCSHHPDFSICSPCHILSETICCHTGPSTSQATTFPLCSLLSLTWSPFSSSFAFEFSTCPQNMIASAATSFSSAFRHLHGFHFFSIWAPGCALQIALHLPFSMDNLNPTFALSLLVMLPSRHPCVHFKTLPSSSFPFRLAQFSTLFSLLNKSPHYPPTDVHPLLCPHLLPMLSSQARTMTLDSQSPCLPYFPWGLSLPHPGLSPFPTTME